MEKVLNWSKIDRAIINLAGEWVGLGDVIATTPLVSAIRLASPKCKIYLILTGNRWKPIVDLMEGNPKSIIVQKDFYRLRKLWIYGLLYVRRPWLRTAYFYDYMSPRYRASLLGYIIGAKYRFGYGQNGSTKEEMPLHNTHNLPFNLVCIKPFDFSSEFNSVGNLKCIPKPRLARRDITVKGRMLIDSIGIKGSKKLFAMHPGCSFNHKVRRWPVELFAKLARDLHSKYEICILVILGPDDKELYKNWQKEPFVYFLNNDYSIYDIAAILSRCECLISNDSGIMHLGFSLGVCGIGLFGPTNSVKYYGYYPNCILIQSKHNSICPSCYGTDRYMECGKIPAPCMESIAIDEVMERIEELFQQCVV